MANTTLEVALRAFADGVRREVVQTVSEWADRHRVLSEVSSPEPGRWRTSRVPYLREIMDCLSPGTLWHKVVMMAGAQIGKTECGNNWLGHIIHRSPGPMLYIEPTVDMVKKVSRQRIAPMIEESPALRGLVSEPRSRDSGNTVLVKQFRNGLLMMTGANSASALRSMPVRFLFCDEVDRYPGDVEGEGDPVSLAEKRTSNFLRRKIFLTSTPTIKGLSRIEREFMASDQRRYFVPCPECGHMDWIQWSKGGWRGEEGAHHHIVFEGRDPQTTRLACSGCGALISEDHKTWMLSRGEWRPTAVGRYAVAGFHISTLYSPVGWKSWSNCVGEFLDAKDDPFKLKTWVNTVLGETWEEKGDAVSISMLSGRLEKFKADVPSGVGVLVAAVDTQADRVEVAVKGYGALEESWLVAYARIYGDPVGDKLWHDLTAFLDQKFKHESGREVPISCAVADSGGLHTERVYKYCRAALLAGRRTFPIKGGSVTGKPLVERPTRKNRFRVPLFTLCVDTGKDVVMGRLQIPGHGPGYVHLPDWVDDEYLAQLTAERAVHAYAKGRGAIREWVKLRERNEAFDLEVYCLAALYILGQQVVASLGDRAKRLAEPGDSGPAGRAAPSTIPFRPRPPGWINRWRQ